MNDVLNPDNLGTLHHSAQPAPLTTTIKQDLLELFSQRKARIAEARHDSFVATTVPVSSAATAEAVKITENIFLAVNIALVNELKQIYQRMGVDIWEVIEAAKSKPFGFMPLYPGPGLGGHSS